MPAKGQHHPAEGEVVIGGRDQAAAARGEGGRAAPQAVAGFVIDRESPGRGIDLVAGRQPVQLRRRHAEGGVLHAERREDPLRQEILERHAGGARDQHAEDVGSGVVIHFSPG